MPNADYLDEAKLLVPLRMVWRTRRWARAWKEAAITANAALRLERHISDSQGNAILKLEGAMGKAKSLLRETVDEHSDPVFEGYQGCDWALCPWCTEANELLGDTDEPS
jgi:hypothetical protein